MPDADVNDKLNADIEATLAPLRALSETGHPVEAIDAAPIHASEPAPVSLHPAAEDAPVPQPVFDGQTMTWQEPTADGGTRTVATLADSDQVNAQDGYAAQHLASHAEAGDVAPVEATPVDLSDHASGGDTHPASGHVADHGADGAAPSE